MILTTILTLKHGYSEDAVAEELDLVLAVGEESAHDLAVGSEHSAVGVVTSSQSCRFLDGGCEGQMAEDSHD